MQEVLAKSDEQLCPIVSLCGEWEYDGTFAPGDAALWDADSFADWLGKYAVPGKDLLLALDGEDSPYLTRQCLLKDAGAPVGKLVQKLFVLDKNNMASPETAQAE